MASTGPSTDGLIPASSKAQGQDPAASHSPSQVTVPLSGPGTQPALNALASATVPHVTAVVPPAVCKT